MKRNWLVVVCALALVAAACGSRVEGEATLAGGGDGASGGASASGGQGSGGGGGANQVGTLKAACGKGDGDNTVPKGAYPEDTKGVTADAIKIAVISDKAGPVKVPTVGIEESAEAFVAFCNSLGGINGRRLELTKYDSMIGAHAEATEKACNADTFALVMTGSVLETGAQQMVDCKLVEVGAYGASAAKTLSDRFFTPVPSPANQYPTGSCKYIADKYPDAVKKAAILYGDIPAASNRAKLIKEACEPLGFEFVYDKVTPLITNDFGPFVSEMESEGVEYLTMVSATSETTKLLLSMSDQGFEPEVIDLGQQYYDPELAAATGAEGALVLTNTAPFEEADDNPALQVYLKWFDEVAGDLEPTSLGVQAFSAGLLFAEAAASLGNDLTRENLLKALSEIHEWDGGGLHFPTDPGANKASGCFLYLKVEGGEFTREFPDEGFECNPDDVVELEGDFGEGAKEKG